MQEAKRFSTALFGFDRKAVLDYIYEQDKQAREALEELAVRNDTLDRKAAELNEKLEAMTAVCSVGIDMVIIPGDTTPAVISALIADEAAIGMVNSKTTAVRVIPAIGRKAGEILDFGGLLGYGPIMPVNQHDPSVFINRGGRLPAPMQSLKN